MIREVLDWTWVHEVGHLVTYAADVVQDFTSTFQDGRSTNSFPEDGSPMTTGDYVSSYAQNVGGDEDLVESFTAYMLLPELPEGQDGVARKMAFLDAVPGFRELRAFLQAGGGVDVPPAPEVSYDLELDFPAWMQGTWSGTTADGPITYAMGAASLVVTRTVDGKQEVLDFVAAREAGEQVTVGVLEQSEDFYLHQVAFGALGYSESFRAVGAGLEVEHERWGTFVLVREAGAEGRV